MKDAVLHFLEMLRALPDGAALMIISVLPMFGIRGGMTASYFLHTPIPQAMFYCVTGNFIPVPFIFAFGRVVKDIFKKKHIFEKTIQKLEQKAGQNDEMIKKYGFLGIVLFIALPLPGTGAYMGTFIASLSRLGTASAIAAVICGMLLSSAIMALLISFF